MDTRTVGELRILTPALDPRDLDAVTDVPQSDMHEARVEGQAWAGTQLVGARISHSELEGVDLSEARWRDVTLFGCRLKQVNLSSARFSGLTIERCEFVACRMTGVQFTETIFKNVLFEDCRLDYAVFSGVRTTGPVGLIGSNLTNAVLTHCRLTASSITGCRLADLELNDCSLRGTDLRGNDLSQLHGLLSLRGAIIDEVQLMELAAITVKDLDIKLKPPSE
jgi:uncharacterized protein YjbI with pentapeptide repeats